jgi:hypothetical protein
VLKVEDEGLRCDGFGRSWEEDEVDERKLHTDAVLRK